ncbi:uncharacterized protein LOC144121684 isoform X5 [Amblyomma americanum]
MLFLSNVTYPRRHPPFQQHRNSGGECSYCCCCTSCCLSRYPYRAICASRVGTPTPHPTLKHRQATAAFQPATCLPTCRQFWTRPGLSSGNWRRYQLATFFEGRLQLASVGTPRVGDPSSTKRRPGAGGESADMAAGTVVTYHINSNEDSPSTSSSPSEQRKTQPEEPAEENAAAGGESRERWVLMTMSTLLLLIGCSLFAMLFWLLSEDLVAIPTETIDSPTKLSSEAPTARDPVYRLLRTSVWRKWCEL